MKYLFINTVAGVGSTGRIAADKCRELQAQGQECVLAYGRGQSHCSDVATYKIGTALDYRLHGVLTRLFDLHGFGSKRATRKFLRWAEQYNPDVLWLHNIHGYYLNVEMLFDWIKKRPEMQVKWTLHDCWSFTGHCSYFSALKCDQWKGHCSYCKQLRRYPACCAISSVRTNFSRKRAAFTGVKNLTLITPSQWLADLTRQSFLKEYPVEVHYNTIDTSVFKPTPSDFRARYGLQDKIIVLGVANVWEERKGLFDFYRLAQMLDDRYAIVLVGLTQKQIRDLPNHIRGIRRTNSPQELAAIYTAADVFVNPSVEETFGMTAVEAQACGTPSIVYDGTACAETARQNGNTVVPQDVNQLYRAITGQQAVHGKATGNSRGCTIVCIPRTHSAQELAEIYTAADVFANPTYEDNYPTVNLEAQACGTRVVTYDTGGCRETLRAEKPAPPSAAPAEKGREART